MRVLPQPTGGGETLQQRLHEAFGRLAFLSLREQQSLLAGKSSETKYHLGSLRQPWPVTDSLISRAARNTLVRYKLPRLRCFTVAPLHKHIDLCLQTV